MSSYREEVITGKYLGHCCLAYPGEEKIYDAVTSTSLHQPIVLEESIRKIHLYDFMRCGVQVAQVRRQTAEAFQPDVMTDVPKFFSDVIESILGALYLDCEGDLHACEVFLDKLGLLKDLRRMLDEGVLEQKEEGPDRKRRLTDADVVAGAEVEGHDTIMEDLEAEDLIEL